MKKQAFFAFIISLALTACNQNKTANQIPGVDATVDSAAIAEDTFQEKSLEESYEYAQTVVVNPKLVYDVRAYDGPPTYGKYCIIRRGANNKPDTVVEGERHGIIINTFTADLNKNGKEEIYVVMREPHWGASSYVLGFEFDKNGIAVPLGFDDSHRGSDAVMNKPFTYNDTSSTDFARSDTIFTQDSLLLKWYNGATKRQVVKWKLTGTRFKPIADN